MTAKLIEPKSVPPGMRPIPAHRAVTRVAVVEDDRQLRDTIASFIGQADGFSCVGSYGSGEDALAEVPRVKPDVVLMDIGLPGVSGIECAQALKGSAPQTQIVMHTVYDEGDFLFDALKAGASGYLLKRTTGARLLEALREACEGGMPFTRQMAQQVQDYFRQLGQNVNELDLLAPREAETLRLPRRRAALQTNRRPHGDLAGNRAAIHQGHLHQAARQLPDRGGGEVSAALTGAAPGTPMYMGVGSRPQNW